MGQNFQGEAGYRGSRVAVSVGKKFHHTRYPYTATRWGLPFNFQIPWRLRKPLPFLFHTSSAFLISQSQPPEPPQLHHLAQPFPFFSLPVPTTLILCQQTYPFLYLAQTRLTLLEPTLFASLGLAYHLHFTLL